MQNGEQESHHGDGTTVMVGVKVDGLRRRSPWKHRQTPDRALIHPILVVVNGGASCDGDEAGIRRSVVALILSRVTRSDHGAIGSEADAVAKSACDGDEVRIGRSVVALTECRATPSGHGTIGSEADAMVSSACDGDEAGIRRSIVALMDCRVTPSDHRAIGSQPDAVINPACDGDEVSIRRSVVAKDVT